MRPESDLVIQIPAHVGSREDLAAHVRRHRHGPRTATPKPRCPSPSSRRQPGRTWPSCRGSTSTSRSPAPTRTRSYSFSSGPDEQRLHRSWSRSPPGGDVRIPAATGRRWATRSTFTGPYGSFFLRETKRPAAAAGRRHRPGAAPVDPREAQDRGPAATGAPDLRRDHRRGPRRAETGSSEPAAELPDFTWDHCVSDPAARRPTRATSPSLIEPEHLNDGDVDIYLCGPPPMVEAVRTHCRRQRAWSRRASTTRSSRSPSRPRPRSGARTPRRRRPPRSPTTPRPPRRPCPTDAVRPRPPPSSTSWCMPWRATHRRRSRGPAAQRPSRASRTRTSSRPGDRRRPPEDAPAPSSAAPLDSSSDAPGSPPVGASPASALLPATRARAPGRLDQTAGAAGPSGRRPRRRRQPRRPRDGRDGDAADGYQIGEEHPVGAPVRRALRGPSGAGARGPGADDRPAHLAAAHRVPAPRRVDAALRRRRPLRRRARLHRDQRGVPRLPRSPSPATSTCCRPTGRSG